MLTHSVAMVRSSPEVFVDQIFRFRDFLFENVSDISIILVAVAVSSVILLFAMREILSWLTRSHLIRNEVQSLTKEVQDLKYEIQKLQAPMSIQKQSQTAPNLQTPEKEPRPASFPLS